MIKKTIRMIFYITLFNTILVIFAFLLIKWDIEMHFSNKLEKDHEDYIKYYTSLEDKILYHGFRFEEHKIKTEDGYILTAFRIPGKIKFNDKENLNKEVVIMNHGLLDSSYTFLAHGEKESLPFILAENGYDVWLTNNRGTIFSYEHEDPVKDSFDMRSDYWDFSFHELAQYDMFANIKYVKEITKRQKVNYFCHSQGCIQFFIGYTLDPAFFEKSVAKVGTLGAVLNYKNIDKFFIHVVKKLGVFEWLEYLGIRNIMSFDATNMVSGYICHRALWICKYAISFIVENESTNHIEWGDLTNMYYFQPGGSSTKNLMHWLQILGAETIRQFDHGKEKNKMIYGTEIPPEYEFGKLTNMTIPLFLTTTNADPFCMKEDSNMMMKMFTKNKIVAKDVGNYNHLDYLWAKNAHINLYADMLDFLKHV